MPGASVGERLRKAFETGDFEPLRDLYDQDGLLDWSLPGRRLQATGPEDVVDLLATGWPGAGELTRWEAWEYPTGLTIEFERRSETGLARQRQHLRFEDGRIVRHQAYCARPQGAGIGEGLVPPASLGPVVAQEPLTHPGQSGSRIERVRLADGRSLVLKEVRLDGDVILRLLGGRTIEADLWRTGTFERVPYVLDHGIVDAYLDGTTTMLAMRDVSEYLLGGRRMTRAESRFALGAAAQLHRAFAGEEVSAACPVITRISFLSPQSIATERDGVDYLPKMLAVGWEVFWDSVPGEIAEAIQRVHSRPEELASELGKQTLTLCHGDLRWANLGFADERLIALDWGAASAAPAACDFAWYLFVNGARVDATREQLIADFREAEGELFDERAFELALIAQLAWHGALIAHELIEPSDEGRMRAREELDWWCARVGAALERM